RGIAGIFEPLLKSRVGTRRVRSIESVSGMTVEMTKQPVPELLKFDQQPVRIGVIADDRDNAAFCVLELEYLAEDMYAADCGSGEKHELLVLIGGQEPKALMQKEGADRIPANADLDWERIRLSDSLKGPQELVRLFELLKDAVHLAWLLVVC